MTCLYQFLKKDRNDVKKQVIDNYVISKHEHTPYKFIFNNKRRMYWIRNLPALRSWAEGKGVTHI